MPNKKERINAPKFATEKDEANWWDAHRDMVEENLMAAMDNGTAERGAAGRRIREARTSRNVTIRIAEADLALARKQADEKGLPYQTYMKSLLHEALVRRERRQAS